MGLQSEAFILLLHKLGFHLPADVGKCFPRIPHFWSADYIYQTAQKLGQIKKDDLKMDLSAFDSFSKSDWTLNALIRYEANNMQQLLFQITEISTFKDVQELGVTEPQRVDDTTFAL